MFKIGLIIYVIDYFPKMKIKYYNINVLNVQLHKIVEK